MNGPLTLAPEPAMQLRQIGRERRPLLILDQCLADPDGVLAIAARARFARHGPHYPGIRALVPQAAAQALIAPLSPLLMQTFNLPGVPIFDECYLSLVTTAPKDLQPIQRLPHFDGLERDRLAFLLYLDRAERGGTAFYRQRRTGFETIDAVRFGRFQDSLARDTAEFGLPDNNYIHGDTELYEQIDTITGLFNRAVIYHGNCLHSAALPPNFKPDPEPLSGRLTLNLFLRATG